MATDLERLVVSLDADITKLTRQLAKGGVALDDFGKTADRKAQQASRAINKHLGPASGGSGLSFIQFQELSSAARHSFDALIAGASPLRVLATEGAKASSAIGSDGLGGFAKRLGTSLAGVVTPARIAAGGVLAVGAAAAYTYTSYEEAQRAIRTGLTGVGAASHATVADIDRIGESVSAASNISVASARTIATAIAATGKVDVSQIGAVANLAKGFGALTGKSTEEAGSELAKVFADPAKGVDTLNERLASLDDRTVQYVKHLAEAGDRQGAVQAIINGVQPTLTEAAKNVDVLTRSYQGLKSAISRLATDAGAGIARVVDGPSLEEQLDAVRRSQHSFRLFRDPAADQANDQRARELQDQIEQRDRRAKADADRRAANVLSGEAGDAVRQNDPQFDQIERLKAQRDLIGRGLSSSVGNPDVQIEGGFQHALDAYNSIDVKLKELEKDYQAGGRFAAQALREADFQKATAGLSSYQRGLAQVTFQYQQLIESARKDGDIRSIGTLKAAQDTAVAAFQRDSLEKARSSIAVSGDLPRIIIGAEGNSAARNSRSSASGIGQFIDSTFIDQFKKVFSDQFAQIEKANTGADGKVNDAAVRAAVLSQKNDVGVNERLIENYAREIGVAISQAGFNGQDVRNQYLGYHFGAGGAINLLRADPNAKAADVLGPDVAKANPQEVANRTVGQLLELIYGRVQKNSSAGRSQQSQTIAETANAATYDKSAAAAARLQSIQEQLTADRDKDGELGRRFANAQDLINESSGKLTPELQAQRKAILDLADARAKATSTTLASSFATDQKNALDALGRTQEQQGVFVQAKQFGEPGSDAFNQAASGLERIRELNDVKAEGSTFTKGLVEDLIRGTTAGKALESQLQRILGKLADNAIDSLISSLFKGVLGGGGAGASSGIFGLLGGVLKLAGGGRVAGAGSSNSDSIPAMLSHGEFVVNAQSAAKNAGLLRLINKGGVLRLAAGGPVGSLPQIPTAVSVGSSAGGITYAPTMQFASPAPGVTPDQLARVLANERQQAARSILATYQNAKKRF